MSRLAVALLDRRPYPCKPCQPTARVHTRQRFVTSTTQRSHCTQHCLTVEFFSKSWACVMAL
eukprot:1136841-Pelagomonas_calceolata.AAC.2